MQSSCWSNYHQYDYDHHFHTDNKTSHLCHEVWVVFKNKMKSILLACVLVLLFYSTHAQSPCGYSCNFGAGDLCCSDVRLGPTCYSPRTHQCFSNTLCGLNDRPCGTGAQTVCYNPTTHVCLNGKLCGISQDVCNGVCYDRRFYSCSNGIIVGRQDPFSEPCGSNTCSNFQLCGQAFNGPTCYDSNTSFLCTFITANAVCPRGQACCGIRSVGIVCYDPSVEFCNSNAQFGAICRRDNPSICRTSTI